MDAARLHEYTDEMSMAFSFEELPRPEPERSDDIVVRIEAAGWCHTDNHIVHGDFEGLRISICRTPQATRTLAP